MNDITLLRANLMGGMNEYMKDHADDLVWESWTQVFPDECDEETLMEIAEDDAIWLDVINKFASCCRCLGIID